MKSRMWSVSVALAGLLGAASGCSEPAAPTIEPPLVQPPPETPPVSPAASTYSLYVARADGSNSTLLAPSVESLASIAWSPDGTRIAFEKAVKGGSQIFVINADGSDLTQLTTGGGRTPRWSPDGRRIAFWTSPVGESAVVLMNADGTNRTELTPGDFPTWSPDGARIAFNDWDPRSRDPQMALLVINADGYGKTPITTIGDGQAQFSPDWTKVLFSTYSLSYRGIWVMNSDGTDLTEISSGRHPVWSPDGRRIAFEGGPQGVFGHPGVFAMNASGTDLVQLIANTTGEPAWSPDGGMLAVNAHDGIWTVSAKGTGANLVIAGGGRAAWSPDGVSLAFVRR